MAEIKRSGSSLHYYSFRLRKKLEGILTAPVTVVEAPSGYGKSTAVRDYLMESLPEGTPVYWWNAAEGSNMFAPEKEITRQEMFTLLYNALKAIGKLPRGNSGKQLSGFSDAKQVASWARDAVTLFVETGIIGGNGGKLLATNTTTRAEIAQLLYNLLAR